MKKTQKLTHELHQAENNISTQTQTFNFMQLEKVKLFLNLTTLKEI